MTTALSTVEPPASAGTTVSQAAPTLSTFHVPADPYDAFQRGQSLLNAKKHAEAVACFLVAFRSGPPYLRLRAVIELEKLGEAETF